MEWLGERLASWRLLNPGGEAGLGDRVEAVVERVDELERRMDTLERKDASGSKDCGH